MSGTNQIYNAVLASLRNSTETMIRLQEQAASGQRVNRASDSPADASLIMRLQTQDEFLDTFSKNLDGAVLNLQQASTSMQAVSDSLSRTKQLLTQAASETFGQRDRIPIGQEIDGLLEQAVFQANGATVGGYLFGGTQMSCPPYRVTRSNGKIVAVEYVGSDTSSTVPVAMGIRQSNVIVGDKVFRYDGRGQPAFLGKTGLAAGSGTSSVRGDVWLTVSHGATTCQDAGASGLAPGARSATGDTILGAGHSLTLNVDNRTIRLDDGEATSFNPASDNNLRLTNADGDVVYVDTTGLAPGLSGTVEVALKATGKMTIDDGQTWAALDTFGDNQAVVDSRTGRVLYVDTTDVARTGSEPVRVPGTYDVFGTLIAIRDVLMNTRNLSRTEQSELIRQAIGSVDEVSQTVLGGLTSAGAQLQALDNLSANLSVLKEGAHAQAASLRDADIAEVATELARTQTFYQMTLSAAARVMNLSLLDYL